MPALPVQRRFVLRGRLPTAPGQYSQSNEQELRRILELMLSPPIGDPLGDDVPVGGTNALLEARDRKEGTAATGVSLITSGSVRNANTTGIFFSAGVIGSGHPFDIHTGSGLALRKSSTNSGAQCLVPEWPIFTRWSTQGVTAAISSQMRYFFSCAAMRHAAGAEIGIRNSGNDIAHDNTQTGYALVDDAGVWVVKRRLTSGGGLETVTALASFSSTVMRRISFEYIEGETPTLTIKIDGTDVYIASGEAAMPEYPASSTVGYGPSACENILTLDSRITVEFVTAAEDAV